MSTNNYFLNIFDCTGVFVKTIDAFTSLDYGRQKNNVGAASLVMPGSLVSLEDFGEDYMLEIYRYSNSDFSLVGNTVWLLNKLDYSIQNGCDEVVEIVFMDTISILQRRYNLWYLFSVMNGLTLDYPSHLVREVSDSILQLYNHNFGINTATPAADMEQDPPPPVVLTGIGAANRQMTAISASALPAVLRSPNVPYECAWKECLSAMQELANISENAGIPLWFDIVYSPSTTPGSIGSFSFEVYEGNRGVYRPDLVFGQEHGTLENIKYSLDFTDKKDVVIAIADEIVDTDPNLDEKVQGLAIRPDSYNCLFGGRELVVEQRTTTDNNNALDNNALASLAQNELNAHKGIRKISGDIINVPGQEFFVHYGYGDIVVVDFLGNKFDAEINKFSVKVDDSGETISIPIEATTLIT